MTHRVRVQETLTRVFSRAPVFLAGGVFVLHSYVSQLERRSLLGERDMCRRFMIHTSESGAQLLMLVHAEEHVPIKST